MAQCEYYNECPIIRQAHNLYDELMSIGKTKSSTMEGIIQTRTIQYSLFCDSDKKEECEFYKLKTEQIHSTALSGRSLHVLSGAMGTEAGFEDFDTTKDWNILEEPKHS